MMYAACSALTRLMTAGLVCTPPGCWPPPAGLPPVLLRCVTTSSVTHVLRKSFWLVSASENFAYIYLRQASPRLSFW